MSKIGDFNEEFVLFLNIRKTKNILILKSYQGDHKLERGRRYNYLVNVMTKNLDEKIKIIIEKAIAVFIKS